MTLKFTEIYEEAIIKIIKLPGLGPLMINLNIDTKTNGIYVNNTLT